MLLAIARFKVAREMADAVSAALHRPSLPVHFAKGFLGMEAFAEMDDPEVCWLATRWRNKDSFSEWHGNSTPLRCLAQCGISEELKLEPPFTKIILLQRLPGKQGLIPDIAELDELYQLNNELAKLSRENTKKSHALSRSLDELKKAEAALVHSEKLASLGRMTAGVAHEINNPVSFVIGNHQTLQRDFMDMIGFLGAIKESLPSLKESSPSDYERISRKCAEVELDYLIESIPQKLADNFEGLSRVRDLVHDLSSFSRIDETGFKPCEISECLRSTLRFLTILLKECQVSLETDYAPMPLVWCSPGHLNQAVSNVVINAIQASSPGQSVKVFVFEEEDRCVIKVEDRGPGIPPEILPRVFEPFFTTKPVGVGTGLGLSIAFQVVKAHRGEIKIDSALGAGSTVRIEIPVHASKPEPEGKLAGCAS